MLLQSKLRIPLWSGSSTVQHPFEALLENPWRLLETLLDGPLHPGGRTATENLLDRAAVGSETRLLDIGCGTGDTLGLARERGAQAVGLDHQPTDAGDVQGDLMALPFRETGFDVVLGECVLCLSPDLGRTLEDVERILQPGGRLALSDITVEGQPPTLPAPIDELLCLNGPREQADIRRQMEYAGFEIREMQIHRDDLLAMRDRLGDAVDYERLVSALGDRGTHLREGANGLERAIESGRLGYVSIIATPESPTGG
jgi:arsenite methyltransferase